MLIDKNAQLFKFFKFKRLIYVLFCIILNASVSLISVNAETISYDETRNAYSKGDSTGDGKITAADYLTVKRIYLDTYHPDAKQFFAADINNDREITSIDFLMEKRYFLETYYFSPTVMKTQEILTEQQIDGIKTDFVEYFKTAFKDVQVSSLTPADIIIGKYYGSYNGCYALFISHREIDPIDSITTKYIAGYEFLYSSGQTLMVYKDNNFVDLNSAYETGLINKDEVYDLSCYFNKERF